MNKRLFLFFVICIALLTIAVRLYRIGAPVADWHSWRQSDTASVARNFLKFGFDPTRPRFDDLSNIASGRDNPLGYRMVEFPLYQLVAASIYKILPSYTIEVWLRIVTIAAAVGTSVVLAYLVAQLVNPGTGLTSAFVYAVLPYSIYYGRTILPETFGVFWAILSLFLLSKTHGGDRKNWGIIILAGVAGAIALLVKPTTGFLLLPSMYLLLRRFGYTKHWFIALFVYSFTCLLPLLLWRKWIGQFPEGIPAYLWLLNSNNIRFKGAWFHWLFAERLGNLMLGYWGLIPFALGLLLKPTKEEGWFTRWFLAGSLLYLIVFATGNVQHDYYQILLLPVVSIFVGKGFGFLISNKAFSRLISYVLLLTSFLFMISFSWFTLRTYFWINRQDIVEAGRLADTLLPKDAKVIAPYNGDTSFLYQTNRQGWPIGFDIEKKIKMGATAYVTVSPTDNDLETKQLANCFTVLVRNDHYAIIDLTKPTKVCVITNP